MPNTTTHEIVLRGRLAHRLLGPFLDEFTVEHGDTGVTRLVGTVRDSSHLHGLVAYLASIHAELISINTVTSNTVTPIPVTSTPVTSTRNTRSNS